MGEMGREFDGGYAEYALLPNSLLMPVTSTLPWDVLAALPETYLTAQGALDALGVLPGSGARLLIRGGTSSVGMAAASIASGYGVSTAATTRRPGRTGALTAAGADCGGPRDGNDCCAAWAAIRAAVQRLPDQDLLRRLSLACCNRLLRGGGP
jgi:NADPH:quinone reductase-like Zn-dependent oxidoreductase